MAKTIDVTAPPKFNVDGNPTGLSTRWKQWRDGFDLYLTASAVTDVNQKRALLLHCGGDRLQQIFATLTESTDENATDEYKKVIYTLNEYFLPKQNKRFERHIFRSTKQEEGETISQYVTRLRVLSKTCEFHNIDDELVDQVIEKCISSKLRKTLLKIKDLTIAKLLETAQILESSEHQAKQYDSNVGNTDNASDNDPEADEINRLSKKSNFNNFTKRRQFKKSSFTRSSHVIPSNKFQEGQCYRCGSKYHLADKCEVTKGKNCFNCGKLGHLASVCKSRKQAEPSTDNKINYLLVGESSNSDSDDEYCFTIKTQKLSTNIHTIKIEDISVDVLIDSGSSINVLNKTILDQMSPQPILQPYYRKVYGYNSNIPLEILGSVKLKVSIDNVSTIATFIVIPNDTSILGSDTAKKLNMLRVGPPTRDGDVIYSISKEDTDKLNEILRNYEDRFTTFGKWTNVSAILHRDSSKVPKVQKFRRLPPLLQKKVDTEIDKLLELDIIEPVTSPPTWVNPLVVVKKPDDTVRLCVDMREANEAIIRQPYQIPTLDEMLQEFNGCKVFAKLDLNKGYHQIELDKDSRDLTAFACHKGIFRYKRLIQGASPASEICQRELELILTGLQRVRNISDDIIIGGLDNKDLLENCKRTLQRLREHNVSINKKKCEFLKSELIYMGHRLSGDGVSPDPSRIAAITALKSPNNVSELRSFLGMVTYCSRFIPNYASLTHSLRTLIKQNVEWNWDKSHEKAFNDLKQLLSSADVLAYYNHSAETKIITDASPIGLGGVILQKQSDNTWRPISYASRALTLVEQKYSQIERECLAVLFSINRFKMYLYGLKFVVYTDHKPLIPMFSGTRINLPPRIERCILKLTEYDFSVVYLPGSKNSADYLSRSNPLYRKVAVGNMEDHINSISEQSIPVAISLSELSHATKQDNELSVLKECLIHNDYNNPAIHKYRKVFHDLSTTKDLVLMNHKILIPISLRQRILKLAHEGHQGVVRTKQRLRKKVWWPGMNYDAEQFVMKCHACQVTGRDVPPTPVINTTIPKSSWLALGCDLCGPFPSGESLLVCVDYYSRFPEVEVIHKTTSSIVATKLRKLFCRYGPPEIIVTDNGPQFQKKTEFTKLLKEFGVKHRKVTPYYPEANGEVERFNRNIKKCVQTAITDGVNWRIALENYLLSYRNTPHATTGKAPAEVMFGRNVNDKLPNSCTPSPQSTTNKILITHDSKMKKKMKQNADLSRNAKPHSLVAGDLVLLKNLKKGSKITPRWIPTPGTIKQVKGNSIIINHEGKSVCRASKHVKTYFTSDETPAKIATINDSDSDDDDVIDLLTSIEVDNTIPSIRNIPVIAEYNDEFHESAEMEDESYVEELEVEPPVDEDHELDINILQNHENELELFDLFDNRYESENSDNDDDRGELSISRRDRNPPFWFKDYYV